MRLTALTLVVLSVLAAAAAPASATDAKTFRDQAEKWCSWQGDAQRVRGEGSGHEPWVLGCSTHVQPGQAPATPAGNPGGRLLQDRDSSPGERPRLR